MKLPPASNSDTSSTGNSTVPSSGDSSPLGLPTPRAQFRMPRRPPPPSRPLPRPLPQGEKAKLVVGAVEIRVARGKALNGINGFKSEGKALYGQEAKVSH